METPVLAFVIPARNEARHIERCLRSIADYCSLPAEVVVVDNGSTDDTARIASTLGARVVSSTATTIGEVRNRGVSSIRAEFLVFLDADCTLTADWSEAVASVLDRIREGRFVWVGSQVYPPEDEQVFLWRHWFEPFVAQTSASHVGSANMVCRASDFRALGGFDETLATGEDYELCARVKAAGGTLVNVPQLRVDHYGFPRTLGDFIRRERWHGRGDVASVRHLARSKVAVVSTAFAVTSLGAMIAAIAGAWVTSAVSVSAAVGLVVATAVAKLRHGGLPTVVAGLVIVPAYFLGRCLSLVDRLVPGRGSGSPRA